MKLRNIVSKETGVDIAITEASKNVEHVGRFRVDEIDLRIDPKEITLHSYDIGMPFIVDLSDSDIVKIKDIKLTEGTNVIAKIFSITNHQGMTSAWKISSFELDVSLS